jgi:hypothetical protein
MKTLSGKIELNNLPPHRGLSVNIAFFLVQGENATKPFRGDPPGNAIKDVERVFEAVDFAKEITVSSREIPFSLSRPPGYYYIQSRFILYRIQDNKVYAQAEQFFFGKRTLPLFDDISGIILPAEWPSIPLSELSIYRTFQPTKSQS